MKSICHFYPLIKKHNEDVIKNEKGNIRIPCYYFCQESSLSKLRFEDDRKFYFILEFPLTLQYFDSFLNIIDTMENDNYCYLSEIIQDPKLKSFYYEKDGSEVSYEMDNDELCMPCIVKSKYFRVNFPSELLHEFIKTMIKKFDKNNLSPNNKLVEITPLSEFKSLTEIAPLSEFKSLTEMDE